MSKNYEYHEDEPQMACEAIMAYNSAVQPRPIMSFSINEATNSEKKKFLRNNLHYSTAQYLESQDWLEDKPFPTYAESDDDSWIDEAEVAGTTDIIDSDIVNMDRIAWNNLR